MQQKLTEILALDCQYSEQNGDSRLHAPAESLEREDTSSKLDEILRRLDRIESACQPHEKVVTINPSLFQEPAASCPVGSSLPDTDPASSSTGTRSQTPPNCQINPNFLRPSYLNLITDMNVLQTLENEGIFPRQVTQKYLSTVHTWMPMLSSDDLFRRFADFENLNFSSEFSILILSMYTLIRKKSATGTEAESPVYLMCKHLFAVTYSLAGVSWDLLRAGVLLALYEHIHGISEKSKMTIGLCITMLSLLLEKENRGDGTQFPKEEMTRLWWSIAIVDRYINPLPLSPSGRFLIDYADPLRPLNTTESGTMHSDPSAQAIQYSSIQAPWKSLPTDHTLSGESKAAQLLGQVQQFIHRAEFSLNIGCHEYALFHEKILTVLTCLKTVEYCPFRNDSHRGYWTSLSAVLLFCCFLYQKAVDGGVEDILTILTPCTVEAVQVADERAKNFTEARLNMTLDCHEVTPSMITCLYLGALGESLLVQRGLLDPGVQYHCKGFLIALSGEWGLARHRAACLSSPSPLPIYQMLQRG
ncbi:hypothetical protein ARAM_002834 [Aspergillus rambellii]|uniref:Transcription factor domain-containing protein n=1 Tax=Aspergillus rambellii TaxID=308745 RepID=A0A0F8WAI9_9EURO|nr:hypothetical protein ARAM_002834 [Aspergillus rambellii]